MGGLLRDSQGCAEAPRGPKDLSVALSDLMIASPLAAYAGEASSPSSAYSTACSKVIARPSAYVSTHVCSSSRARRLPAPGKGSGQVHKGTL
jgi:hypothetical protein